MRTLILAAAGLIGVLVFPVTALGEESNHDHQAMEHGHHGKKHTGYAHKVLSEAEALNLSNKQLGLITRIHLQHKKARKDLRKELHKSMMQIHQGLMDPATEDKVIQKAAKAHTETINKLVENALTERKRVNSILSGEQKEQITPMQKEHEHGGIRHFEEEYREPKEKKEAETSTGERQESQHPRTGTKHGKEQITPMQKEHEHGGIRHFEEKYREPKEKKEAETSTGERQESQHPRTGTKHGAEQPTFSELDKNQDDYLSKEEAQASKALSRNFKLIDQNNDNRIDRSEFGEFEAMQLRGFDHGGPPAGYEYGEGRNQPKSQQDER